MGWPTLLVERGPSSTLRPSPSIKPIRCLHAGRGSAPQPLGMISRIPLLVLLACAVAHSALGSDGTRKRSSKARNAARSMKGADDTTSAQEVLSPAEEERRYQAAKEQARSDPLVQELKAKSDTALGNDQEREASIAYYRALFQRMREIDDKIAERAKLTEDALVHRLSE
jgi:hypothetical protein